MSKFLLVVPPFFGHISPTLSVGAGLLQKGHEVIWVGLQDLAPGRLPAGGRWVVPPELAGHGEELERILKRQDDGPYIGGAEVLKLALEETYLPFCRLLMKGLPGIAGEFRPDVMVSDCISFAGALCAYEKGIPYATTTPVPPNVMGSAMEMPKIREWQERLILGLQCEYGIYTDKAVIHSDRLNIVFTSREFAGITDPPSSMQFVGPVRGRPDDGYFDWDKLERLEGPRVFVSLGTLLVDIRREFFRKIVQAFAGRPVTIVAATDPGILPAWPDNFIVQSFVPQSKVMAKMDAVICHGGFNTVNDALLNALPILLTPIAYDHFHTASLIERSGCGLAIRYKRLRVADLEPVVRELLERDAYRLAAGRMRDSFLRAGGSGKAVELLEGMAAECGAGGVQVSGGSARDAGGSGHTTDKINR
jgi:MGT family glycosyltransferase